MVASLVRIRRLTLLALAAWLPLGSGLAQRITPTVEDELRARLLEQPVGAGTLADLALPDAFVERVGSRLVRASFRERFHRVVPAPVEPGTEDAERLPGWVWAAGYGALTLAAAGWMARAARRTA